MASRLKNKTITSEAQATKATDKWTTSSSYTAKELLNTITRQHTEQKISTYNTSI